ncbi:MAG: hypothetical protein JOZ81_35265 [Chloroflexi bacterium]|nr:hypothetical protein [Chloroflexota bacterium]MBV9543304.1 hypothetical protein [Chloroflexota bacterium]
MEEVLGILGFSFGASLGVSAVRSVVGGSRPVFRDVLKMGLQVWDGLANVAESAREEAAAASSDPAVARRGRRRAEPQKIVIAHE